MSSSHHDQTGHSNPTVLVEPDDVPTGMLTRLAVAITIGIVVSVGFANWLFNTTLASELAAKGYSESSVPSANSGAKTW